VSGLPFAGGRIHGLDQVGPGTQGPERLHELTGVGFRDVGMNDERARRQCARELTRRASRDRRQDRRDLVEAAGAEARRRRQPHAESFVRDRHRGAS
jgi:hypothetical protein